MAKYKKRLEKNRAKLFTFLDYDGIPWNNNNAEHAIKAFAMLRNVIRGASSEKGLREYLTLLSICETCKYKGVSFLDFLRSARRILMSLLRSDRRSRIYRNLNYLSMSAFSYRSLHGISGHSGPGSAEPRHVLFFCKRVAYVASSTTNRVFFECRNQLR